MKIQKKFQEVLDYSEFMWHKAKNNPWKFILVDLIKFSGISFVIGCYNLALAAGSSAGSYYYHWMGLIFMLISMILARMGI